MFDVVVLAVIGILALSGLWKGLVRQVVGLLGLVLGFTVAMKFYALFATRFLPGFRPATGNLIGFLIILVGCMIAASLVGWIIGKVLSAAGLGAMNRIAGGLVGAAKGYFAVAAVTMMLIAFLPTNSPVLRDSRSIGYIEPMARVISKLAPKSIRAKYEEKADKLRRSSAQRKTRAKCHASPEYWA
jgi:membrane protein required for colicin V production